MKRSAGCGFSANNISFAFLPGNFLIVFNKVNIFNVIATKDWVHQTRNLGFVSSILVVGNSLDQ